MQCSGVEYYFIRYFALQLDPNLPSAHSQLGNVLAYKKDYDASIGEHQRAATLNPNLTDSSYPTTLSYSGQHAKAIEIFRAHMRLDPFYPPWTVMWLGIAYYMIHQYSEALPHLRECVTRAPNSRGAHLWSAANYAQMGLFEEARKEAAEVMRIDPEYTIQGRTRQAAIFRHQKDLDHAIDGVRKAGLPEA